MTRLEEFALKVSRLDEGDIFKIIFSSAKVQREIIRLNTEEQLFFKGVDSNNITLGDYTPFTVEIKKEKGQRFENITLRDTGDFYESFRVRATKEYFEISADPIKEDTNLFIEFGIDILGLTDESTKKLKEVILPEFNRIARQKLGIL